VSSPAPPTEISDGTRPSSPSAGVPAPPESDIPPRFSGGARGGDILPHYSNYFQGRDSTNWRSRVPHYQTVIVPEVWPGIDIEYRADKQGVETIYHVKPGADPTQIQLAYHGLDAPLRVDSHGNLILSTSLGEVKETAPYSYQLQNRTQKVVSSSVRLLGENRVGFAVDEYNTSKELVIDPLIYSTYFGANDGAERISRVLVLPSGEMLLCGDTNSSEFPSTPGSYQEMLRGRRDAYITKLGTDAREIVFSTMFGSSGYVRGHDIEAMPNGDLLLVGSAGDPGQIPLTTSALDTTIEYIEGFVALFSSNASELLYSSYIGAADIDIVYDAVVTSAGLVILTGSTTSGNFPTTPDALYPTLVGGLNIFQSIMDVYDPVLIYSSFFGNASCNVSRVKLENDSTVWLVGLVYSTGLAVTADAFQSEYGGEGSADAFISRIGLNPPANHYTTYFGGEGQDEVYSFDILDSTRLALFGSTRSDTWPTTSGAYDTIREGHQQADGFITIFSPPNEIVASTLLGGARYDQVEIGARSPDGSYVVAGFTDDDEFPITSGAIDSTFGPNIGVSPYDLFITKFSPDLRSLQYSTYFGGEDIENIYHLWIPSSATIWIAGGTQSNDFPTTPDALRPQMNWFDYDGFISCIGLATEAETPPELVLNFSLVAFPNPFNPTTTLSFTLPKAAHAELLIHNILGQQVEHINLGRLTAGAHHHQIGNSKWASGILIATLKTPAHSQSTKLLLLR